MELQVGVKALLKNKDGKYLLIRRSQEKYPEIGAKWDIVGGRIEVGSSLFENLAREIKEEVGLTLTSEVKLIAAQDILRADKHVVRLTYRGEIEGDPTLNEDHTEFRWVSLTELKRMEPLDSYVRELLEKNIIHE